VIWSIIDAGKYEVEWCVGPLVSPNGISSKVTLNCPSWNPRILFLVSPSPGPFADMPPPTLGAIAAMFE